jgi:hypothetical protein
MYHVSLKYLTIIREVNQEDNHKTEGGTVYQQTLTQNEHQKEGSKNRAACEKSIIEAKVHTGL